MLAHAAGSRGPMDLHDGRQSRTTIRTFSVRRTFPPSDGYEPPEDPLLGVARQIDATARLKAAFPQLVFVGSAYTLPAGLAAARRAVQRPARADAIRRPRAPGAFVSRSARRRAERPAAEAQIDLPHVQRLHDRATPGPRFRLLSRSTRSTRRIRRSPRD